MKNLKNIEIVHLKEHWKPEAGMIFRRLLWAINSSNWACKFLSSSTRILLSSLDFSNVEVDSSKNIVTRFQEMFFFSAKSMKYLKSTFPLELFDSIFKSGKDFDISWCDYWHVFSSDDSTSNFLKNYCRIPYIWIFSLQCEFSYVLWGHFSI